MHKNFFWMWSGITGPLEDKLNQISTFWVKWKVNHLLVVFHHYIDLVELTSTIGSAPEPHHDTNTTKLKSWNCVFVFENFAWSPSNISRFSCRLLLIFSKWTWNILKMASTCQNVHMYILIYFEVLIVFTQASLVAKFLSDNVDINLNFFLNSI